MTLWIACWGCIAAEPADSSDASGAAGNPPAAATNAAPPEKVAEFAPRWAQNPPKYFIRWRKELTPETIEHELAELAKSLFDKAVQFDEPVVKTLQKNVSPENVQDPAFLNALQAIMRKRRVPPDIIGSLFESGQAAPETGAFL